MVSDPTPSGVPSVPDSLINSTQVIFYSEAESGNITIATGVSVWADLGLNGNDMLQPTTGNQPVFSGDTAIDT